MVHGFQCRHNFSLIGYQAPAPTKWDSWKIYLSCARNPWLTFGNIEISTCTLASWHLLLVGAQSIQDWAGRWRVLDSSPSFKTSWKKQTGGRRDASSTWAILKISSSKKHSGCLSGAVSSLSVPSRWNSFISDSSNMLTRTRKISFLSVIYQCASASFLPEWPQPIVRNTLPVCTCLWNMININSKALTIISFSFDKSGANSLYLHLPLPVFCVLW